jgi:hypothetical protein
MTTYVPLSLNNNQSPPFQSNFTMDGNGYNGAVTWNVAGQRWYFTLTNQAGTVIWNGALVGSPPNYDILLAPGIFMVSTLLYREDTGNFEQNP